MPRWQSKYTNLDSHYLNMHEHKIFVTFRWAASENSVVGMMTSKDTLLDHMRVSIDELRTEDVADSHYLKNIFLAVLKNDLRKGVREIKCNFKQEAFTRDNLQHDYIKERKARGWISTL